MLVDPLREARLMSVELYLFFGVLEYANRLVSFHSLLMDHACRIGHSKDVCDHLDNHPVEKAEGGNNLDMGVMLSSSLPAVAVAVFLGPWSDKYSSYLPLVFAIGGMFHTPLLHVGSALLSGLSGRFIISVSATCRTSRMRAFAQATLLCWSSSASAPRWSSAARQIYQSFGYVATTPHCFESASFLIRETRDQAPHQGMDDVNVDHPLSKNSRGKNKRYSNALSSSSPMDH